ncbi:MAG: MOSC domain-containing protein [Pseudomonadota bacterium]
MAQKGRVEALCVGVVGIEELGKRDVQSVQVDCEGLRGDRHRGYTRVCWEADKQPPGTERRNERQWSAVALEELDQISRLMELDETLTAADVGANLCISGVTEFSRLPRGTVLKFPSGATLMIEEYNPPCLDMGEGLVSSHRRTDGQRLEATAFSQAAKFSRGVVGVVDVAGEICVGDEVIVEVHRPPAWLSRTSADA